MMDNGFPFTTEPNSLMELIAPPTMLNRIGDTLTGSASYSNVTGNLGQGALSNTPWRKLGVKYSNNEIYFDIVEEIDCTVDP
jgi:AP-3 complex subunit mu